MKRRTGLVLGLSGGAFGILCAFIAVFIGGAASAMEAEATSNVIGLGWAVVALSMLDIVGSVMIKNKAQVGGAMMTIATIGEFICISFIYILSVVLLLIGGLMGIFRKEKVAASV
ncbi:DUF4064 domain-containing protein [Bacillus cereus group sp. BfR-BA-01428]|uniref:DUF4064 domain-containing protein n=1 Tax=Bacillus cereus group TaxID=86661 RepID=UPI001F58BF92